MVPSGAGGGGGEGGKDTGGVSVGSEVGVGTRRAGFSLWLGTVGAPVEFIYYLRFKLCLSIYLSIYLTGCCVGLCFTDSENDHLAEPAKRAKATHAHTPPPLSLSLS